MNFRLIIIIFAMNLLALQGYSQEIRARVAVVTMIDTTVTHVYGNRWYSTTFQKDIFNYGKETVTGLVNILGDANIEVTLVEKPPYLNKMGFLNMMGKPSKDLQYWFQQLKDNQDMDYLIMVVRKFEPENKISHRYLNGKQYGMGTYANYPDALSIFSFVGYYIFNLRTGEEIKINKNHDQYLLMDLRLDHRMTYHELKNLPKKYLDLTRDKMRNIVNTRNVEIKRTLLEDLNQ